LWIVDVCILVKATGMYTHNTLILTLYMIYLITLHYPVLQGLLVRFSISLTRPQTFMGESRLKKSSGKCRATHWTTLHRVFIEP
jgi:hypothetical protein